MNLLPFVLAFFWGLTGGFSHCIGMCGVFVVAYSGSPEPGKSRVPPIRHFLFHFGRLCTLMLLGALAGLAGSITHAWGQAAGVFSLISGIVLLGLAVGFAGIVPWLHVPEPDVLGAGGGFGRRQFLKALQNKSALKPLLIGFFVGLLPCGLTYQALMAAAVTARPIPAATLMALFCLGTVPGLLILGFFGSVFLGGALMKPAFRSSMTKVAAAIMAVMAVGFIIRGLQYLI